MLFLLAMSIIICFINHKDTKSPSTLEQNETLDIISHRLGSDKSLESPHSRLANSIESLSNLDRTHYAVFIAYPDENTPPYIYQSSSMRSASMIKVFILAMLMEKVRDGQLSLDDTLTINADDKVDGAGVLSGYPTGISISINKLARLMITESDNTATNILIDLLGMNNINLYIQQNGYNDSKLQRKMMDTNAVKNGRDNYTSVTDLGNFFIKLYKHQCVSYELDELMLEFLKGQTDNECFPTALPNATIAHKTGELAGLYDDGGIIYTQNRNVIVVIMTENYSTRSNAIHTIKEMAKCAATN